MSVQEQLVLTQNYHNRSANITKFALHTMEGFTGPNGAVDCAIYFQGPVGASSHWCVDNYHPNQVVCGVYEQYSAWTQANMNDLCLSLEQAGYASYSRDTWLNNQGTLLTTTAALVRQMCDKHKLPIRALNTSESQDSWTKGVTQHMFFGTPGGNHSDCGDSYPMDKIIEWAKAGTPAAPEAEASNQMSVSVASYGGETYLAGVGANDNQVYFKAPGWPSFVSVDPGSFAMSGVSLDIDDKGLAVLGYTNRGKIFCTYHKTDVTSNDPWTWTSHGGDFK